MHCLSVIVTDFVTLNIFLPSLVLKMALRAPELRVLPFMLRADTVTSASSKDIL